MGRIILLISMFTVTGLFLLVYPVVPMDDAYIYMRYAENFNDNGFISWNADGTEVSCGMTGLSLFFLEVLFGPFIGYENSAVFISVLFLLFSVWMLHRVVGMISGDIVTACIVLGGFVLVQTNYAVTYDCLETTMALFVSLWLVDLYLRDRFCLMSVLAPVVFMTRPEMVLLLFLLIVPRWRLVLLSGALIGVYEVIYYGYFCHWLPLSYYMKTDGCWHPFIFADLRCFTIDYLVFPIVLLLVFCGFNQRVKRLDLCFRIVAFVLIVVVKYFHSELHMGYDHRFLYTFVGLVFVMMAMVFGRDATLKRGVSLSMAVFVFLMACVYGLNTRVNYVRLLENDHTADYFFDICDYLQDAGVDGKSICTCYAGYIPFSTRMNHVDSIGLVSRDILFAGKNGEERGAAAILCGADYFILSRIEYEENLDKFADYSVGYEYEVGGAHGVVIKKLGY